MSVLAGLKPERVFHYFEIISGIPRGSGNCAKIADYCVGFAEALGLKCHRDSSNNIVIYKPASVGYEASEPIILQGHLDMVCQKEEDCPIDFENDGLELYVDGEFVRAKGTTLGADNGIAVAMVMAILEDDTLSHPAIEAVFTTDEETGMFGALALDASLLSAKRMINLDSEEIDIVTVSCAGGSDFRAELPINHVFAVGTEITLKIGGLLGGHSGICIDKNRVNADILAGRILSEIIRKANIDLISISGGDKANAIPNTCEIKLCVNDVYDFSEKLNKIIAVIKEEIASREPDFNVEIIIGENKKHLVFGENSKRKTVLALVCAPNGIVEMSAEIEGLVQTSLNLGILKTTAESVNFGFALRSNKKSALKFLEKKLKIYFEAQNAKVSVGGHYPPWEYNKNSVMQGMYVKAYKNRFGKEPGIEAIHAGLECGVFADKIEGFDALAIGPEIHNAHTVNECLGISSVADVYEILIGLLADCK